jgi:hypothetical protein
MAICKNEYRYLAFKLLTITAFQFFSDANPTLEYLEPGMGGPAFYFDSVWDDSVTANDQTGKFRLLFLLNTQADPDADEPDPSRTVPMISGDTNFKAA